MDRVFLDASVLFSATCNLSGVLKKLWILARAGKVELVSSAYAAEEARRNLSQLSQSTNLKKLLQWVEVRAVTSNTSSIEGPIKLPEKDKPILIAAIAMKATHLLTGDFSHFGSFYGKKIEGVLIMAPAEYLKKW